MDAARPQMLRRQDWDFSGRTKVMVEVMLENLAKEKSASERQGIVDVVAHVGVEDQLHGSGRGEATQGTEEKSEGQFHFAGG